MVMHEKGVGLAPAMTALAVVAAVVGSLWWDTREEPAAVAREVAAPPAVAAKAKAPAPRQAVVAFAGFANAEPPPQLPLDHGYTAHGLRLLAAALAEQGGNSLWRDRALRLEEAAAELERDASFTAHADRAREAFIEAGEWIDDLRGSPAPVMADAARKVDANLALRSQRLEVNSFFRAAADALRGSEPAPTRASRLPVIT